MLYYIVPAARVFNSETRVSHLTEIEEEEGGYLRSLVFMTMLHKQ